MWLLWKEVKKMRSCGMYLILCCCTSFLCGAWAPDCKVFIPVVVGLVLFCWELDVLIQAGPDSLFRSARNDGESFTVYDLLGHLNVCKALDVFWCRWRLTDARGAIRNCKRHWYALCASDLSWEEMFPLQLCWETSPPLVQWCLQGFCANVAEGLRFKTV